MTTRWDPGFDPRVRQIVNRLSGGDAELVCSLLEAAHCQTLDAVKRLSSASPCLASLPEATREELLEAARSASVNGK